MDDRNVQHRRVRDIARASVSISPAGERFPLPRDEDYDNELTRLQQLVEEQRALGREIVVVMGLGFVGAIMAGVVADSVDRRSGKPGKFVMAMQRPSLRSYWKIPLLNRGATPVEAADPEVAPMIARTVLEKKTLTATFTYDALALADTVIVDVQCDYVKEALGDMAKGHADIAALEESFRVIGDRIQPQCLVLIETTVPPGTTEHIAYPIVKQAFAARGMEDEPLLAHSYERVMPGRNYVASVRDFWRVCSGINPTARERVVRFLSEVLNVEQYPLTVLDRPVESETCKVVENSYRATILAFMDEWSLFAERNGIDLTKVIAAIKMRPTHSNLLFPGPGIGGYCLPKDGALGMWAYQNILGVDNCSLPITSAAININDTRALHVATLVHEGLTAMQHAVAGTPILLCGASYREDVGDTRYSGSELIVRKLLEWGADMRVHDPYVDHWYELENQEEYPARGQSRSRFFKNQSGAATIQVEKDLEVALDGVQALILAIRHAEYLDLDPDWVIKRAGGALAVIDCFGILSDEQIRRYLEMNCEVKCLGRGHIKYLKK